MRRTKIVATIGPETESLASLEKLAQAGVNVFRLNFSHGNHKWHGEVIDRIKKLNKNTGENYAIMLDTKGPEIRTSDLKVPIRLKKGGTLILTVDHLADHRETKKVVVNYDAFIDDVAVGDKILVDNGLMTLKVREKKGKDVICDVLDGGMLGSRRHLNLTGKNVSLDSITKKDWKDIDFGIKKGVDFIALSFVRKANEVQEVQDYLVSKKADIGVIAKVETADAVKHLASILETSDAVMVARGDLGAEIPFTQVPLVQWDMAQMSAKFGTPVIVATQMLESMQDHPMPTRAEVSDVFAASWQRNDAVMLSGETATGKYPVKAVEAMRDIVLETEKNYLQKRSIRKVEPHDERSQFCKSAGAAAEDLGEEICGIVVITRTGYMAKLMANFRPKVPIFAMTNEIATCRELQLMWGTKAFHTKFSSDPEKTILRSMKRLVKEDPKLNGKKFVLLSDIITGNGKLPAMQIREF
jgi:pyruvate kinase